MKLIIVIPSITEEEINKLKEKDVPGGFALMQHIADVILMEFEELLQREISEDSVECSFEVEK